MEAVFRSVTPMIPSIVPIDEAIAFYTEHMGFRVLWRGNCGAGIVRDGVALNLVENTNLEWANNTSLSIGVSSLDDLYEEFRTIPAKIGPLEVKAWGRREFHLIAPSGVCFQFYES
ncbi:MAG: hypothetical protein JO043_01250 [Candidatus Eremiobacteraeota bacterium]|nr:hypothetical protein [Candidatus Eremiobacteraeota bacterium]